MASSIIRVILTGDSAGLRHAADESTRSLEKTGKASGGFGGSIKAGFAIGAGAAIAFGVDAVKSANAFELAHARLQTAITNTNGKWKNYSDGIEQAINQGAKFGHNDAEISDALATMTTGMGNADDALGNLQLAEDIAAAKGIDLNSAALLVTKGSEGQTKALKALGLDLPVAAGGAVKLKGAEDALRAATENLRLVEEKVHDGRLKGPAATDALKAANDRLKSAQDKVTGAQEAGHTIITTLEKKYSGSASAASDTFAGKQKMLAARFDNLKTQVGIAIEKGLVNLVNWYDKSGSPALKRFGGQLYDIEQHFVHMLGPIGQAIHDLGVFGNTVGKIAEASPFGPSNPAGIGKQKPGNPLAGPSNPMQSGPQPHTSVVVNVHGADPNATARAISQQARRNG